MPGGSRLAQLERKKTKTSHRRCQSQIGIQCRSEPGRIRNIRANWGGVSESNKKVHDTVQTHLQHGPKPELRHVSPVLPAHLPVSVAAVGDAAAEVVVVEVVDVVVEVVTCFVVAATGLKVVDVVFKLVVLDNAAVSRTDDLIWEVGLTLEDFGTVAEDAMV